MDELVRQGKRNLTVITNDPGLPGVGVGKLVTAGLLRKVIVSHIGLNPETQQQMLAGKLEVELVPQGTLIERIRSGGFGLGGILSGFSRYRTRGHRLFQWPRDADRDRAGRFGQRRARADRGKARRAGSSSDHEPLTP
jgi:hypothetical protein